MTTPTPSRTIYRFNPASVGPDTVQVSTVHAFTHVAVENLGQLWTSPVAADHFPELLDDETNQHAFPALRMLCDMTLTDHGSRLRPLRKMRPARKSADRLGIGNPTTVRTADASGYLWRWYYNSGGDLTGMMMAHMIAPTAQLFELAATLAHVVRWTATGSCQSNAVEAWRRTGLVTP